MNRRELVSSVVALAIPGAVVKERMEVVVGRAYIDGDVATKAIAVQANDHMDFLIDGKRVSLNPGDILDLRISINLPRKQGITYTVAG